MASSPTTRTHYRIVGETISRLPFVEGEIAVTACRFARRFAAEDPKFDRNFFMACCGFSPRPGTTDTWISHKHGTPFVDAPI